MAKQQQQAKSGGNRKVSRNLDKCKKYKLSQRRYKNKIRRARKRIANMPESVQKKVLAQIKIHRSNFEMRTGLLS